GIPVVMAVNMSDLVEKSGDKIHVDKLSAKLGCEACEISALKGTGIDVAVKKAIAAAKANKSVAPVHEFGEEVEKYITAAGNKLGADVKEEQKRFFAIKLLEKDDKIIEQMQSKVDVSAEIEDMEKEFDDDTESIITNERYVYISSIIDACYTKNKKRTMSTSDKIDKWVTNRWLALPIFALVMFIVYYVSVTTVGAILTDWTNDTLFGEWIVPGVQSALESVNCADWLTSLIADGVVSGVGAVLGFVPQMLVLFIFLAFLESCGYMARVAFIMDRIFRKFGLSGKSFIPMLIGSGCGVPGVMASRTIENDRDRKMTIMTTTFVPCGAKLPIIALIAGAFFQNAGWVSWSAYFVGIAAIICSGIILKKTKMFAGEPAPFVMELPAYHWPTVGNVLRSMWERGWSFIKKAGTIILLSTIVLWFLQGFGWIDGSFTMLEAEQLNDSILAKIGNVIAPIFAPLGFGNWKMAVATVTGLIAKENVVATFGILFGYGEVAEDGAEIWQVLSQTITPVAAYGFLVFNLLCAPCFAAMGAIKREMNNAKWFWFAIGYQTVLAYVVALCIYQIGTLITTGAFGIGTVVAFLLVLGFLYLLFRPYKESKTLNVSIDKKAFAK
ncbi:MAG TPA: ferrous iron transport protein B, partial [Lachnospiraceae bacterium]|nr:ferrous iron transport protein B [Lachnospiraceae bacterium]